MGVPKFYRWTSERYPCLSQVVKDYQIPEFDNLYLDMNGIIHVCSHPNDDDPHFRISEAEIFKNIFHYIEVLFRIIKPKQNFFMAVDGVAPRAKMNQQRGRRFRTAKEAEDNIRRAVQKGQTLPKEERFDSNCITPGTEFMSRLNDHLQYFVNKKISTDPLWQSCNVYLSGHDVPGEGEHKVMDFIRYEKSKEDYDANTRHCLYGLDADLLILGLACHEPHFSLLREEVRFGKQSKRVTKPEETTFHLLHLSLMREYLDFEFGALKETLPFKYDLERIIDDWILLGFLVGNDFVPHLPNLHINHDALPYLYRIYIETMPKLDGYLHDGGFLCLPRFQKFIDAVAKFDQEKFQDLYTDMKWLEGKIGRSVSPNKKKRNGAGKMKFSQLLSQLDDDIMSPVRNPYMALADDTIDDSLSASPSRALDNETRELSEIFGDMGVKDTDGGEELFEMEFRQHKRAYYTEKFNIPTADDAFIATVAYEYVLALQWILHYYFNGLQSWSWYYPYHYAPYVSDIVNAGNFDLKLNKGKPFKPFEQLLAVLPSASKKLLPQAFQSLMVMDTSPIIDYYPTSFKTDLNGKQQEWEAVVLIPFIDEQRLLSAMATHYMRLTEEEKERNSYGSCLKYLFSDDVKYSLPSTYPGVFKDIESCRASCEKIDRDAFRVIIKDLKKGLCDGVKENVYFPGFPTLKHINHHSNLRKAGVRVFQFSSKSNNMVIHIKDTEKPANDAMWDLVGEIVHVEWPYLVEALITGITDGKVKYVLKEPENVVQEDVMNKNKTEDAERWMKITKTNYLEKKGIDVGDVQVLVEAKQLKGKRYACGPDGTVTLEREWALAHSFYAYQSIVQNLSVHTSQFQKECNSIGELYPAKSKCFMMANPHYGCSGEVIEVENGRVRVALSVPPEPDLSEAITNRSYLSDKYHPIDKVCQKIGISQKLLTRITGNLFVRKKSKNGGEGGDKCNIGLKLKFSGRNQEVLGYARRAEYGWTFSESAVDILRTYIERFPEVFEKLAYLPEQEAYSEEDVFPGKTGKDAFEEVLSFIKQLPCYKSDPVKCGSNVLDERIVMAIENAVEDAKEKQHLTKEVKVKVKPHVLFKPTAEFGDLVPDLSTEYYLFDRVVCVRDGGAVPLGYRGTIIGVHEVREDEQNEDSPKEIKYEVLFDEPFLGGLMLRCQDNKGAYMTKSSTLNISHGERKEAAKRGNISKSLTQLQGKAEPKSFNKSSSFQNYSPFSPPKFRGNRSEGYGFGSPRQSTPGDYRQGRSGGRQYTGSGTKSDRGGRRFNDDGDYKSDYWLKGYGEESPSRGYSLTKSGDRFSPSNQKTNRDKKDDFASPPKKSDADFLKMLSDVSKHGENRATSSDQEISSKKDPASQKTEEKSRTIEDKSRTRNKTLQEETALLQEMLGIKSSSSSKAQVSTTSPGRIQMPATSYHTPPRQPTNVLNQLFNTPQSSQLLMNVPASPTSPLMQGSGVFSPTGSLQNWCHHNQMPAPNYTYSSTPQGVHAVVRIGPGICYGGLMCKSRPDAAESAAEIALKQLLQQQSEVSKAFGLGNTQHISPLQQMPSRSPNANQFLQGNQQRMVLHQQFMSPGSQIYPNMSPIHPQIPQIHPQIPQIHPQIPISQPHQMQQPFIQYQAQQVGYRPPLGPQAPPQAHFQQNPHQPLAQPLPPVNQVLHNAAKSQKNIGDGAVQAAFIPLQVNRARKKQEKSSEEPTSDVKKSPESDNIESTPKTGERSVNTSQQPSNITVKESHSHIDKRSDETQTTNKEDLICDIKPKQTKEKTKKKVLLAPSFFAPKK